MVPRARRAESDIRGVENIAGLQRHAWDQVGEIRGVQQLLLQCAGAKFGTTLGARHAAHRGRGQRIAGSVLRIELANARKPGIATRRGTGDIREAGSPALPLGDFETFEEPGFGAFAGLGVGFSADMGSSTSVSPSSAANGGAAAVCLSAPGNSAGFSVAAGASDLASAGSGVTGGFDVSSLAGAGELS